MKFIPLGADESQAITIKSKGFMHLCDRHRDGCPVPGYSIWDTKGSCDRNGWNNLTIDWSDFRKALIKHQMGAPQEKQSMFHGQWFPPEHSIEMRKRLLAAVCREYISPQSLANDLLDWLARGREDDLRQFLLTLLGRVGWLDSKPSSGPPTDPAQSDPE